MNENTYLRTTSILQVTNIVHPNLLAIKYPAAILTFTYFCHEDHLLL
jgi:hypothetical protein